MTNTELLEEKIKDSGKKKAHLARMCGMTPTTFGKYVKGEREFNATHITVLCEELNIIKLTEKEAIFFAKAGA
jgi:hypothetical protein